MEGREVRVALLEGKGAEGEAEGNSVEGVWFGRGGDLGIRDGNFDLWSHGIDCYRNCGSNIMVRSC